MVWGCAVRVRVASTFHNLKASVHVLSMRLGGRVDNKTTNSSCHSTMCSGVRTRGRTPFPSAKHCQPTPTHRIATWPPSLRQRPHQSSRWSRRKVNRNPNSRGAWCSKRVLSMACATFHDAPFVDGDNRLGVGATVGNLDRCSKHKQATSERKKQPREQSQQASASDATKGN